MKNNFLFLLSVVFCMVFVLPHSVSAYIDPGTGSYLYQLTLAGLFSVLFFIGTIVKKIIHTIKKNKKPDQQVQHET